MSGSSVTALMPPSAVTVPWFETSHTPSGSELFMVTRNVNVMLLPAGSVGIAAVTVSPDMAEAGRILVIIAYLLWVAYAPLPVLNPT